tara:strand:+ start:1275 stop:2084 length:810 start_codon:yes stop_codon:yes gene_type:complete
MTIKQQGGVFGRNPTFNDVNATTIDTTTVNAERLNVTAGADSIAAWVQGRASDNAAAVFFASNGGTQYGYAFSNASEFGVSSIGARPLSLGAAGSTAMQIDTSGNANIINGNLIVANGKGIDFSATAGTGTSELFDDYEEGTWTPILQGSITGTATYGANVGSYIKIGNKVHIQGYLVTTAIGTISGDLQIEGLPFTVKNSSTAYAALSVSSASGFNITAGYTVMGRTAPGTTVAQLSLWDLTSGTSRLQGAEWSTNGSIQFSIDYEVT